ncbi:MAG TPA: GntR family transcriptional regulator [Ktedonobacteraceae bacterium]|nr:GntR family transcriptional regulator [Ktedonobacteraceae bacterium]
MLDLSNEKAIYQQIRDQVVEGIASGNLQEGETLPSIRQLAADFGINLHTVNKAYDLLEREGFIQLRRKTGAVIHLKNRLPEDWETRQRTLLAEAYAQHITTEAILQRCQSILAEFDTQHQYHNGPLKGGQQ